MFIGVLALPCLGAPAPGLWGKQSSIYPAGDMAYKRTNKEAADCNQQCQQKYIRIFPHELSFWSRAVSE